MNGRKRVARFQPGPEVLEGRALLSGATLTVGPAGSGAEYTTIGAAVAAAVSGDTIEVAPGVYNERVDVNKPLTLLGAQAGVDARTRNTPASAESIVEGSGGSTAFYVTANGVTINGFTVEGNTSANVFGAGIVLGAGTTGSTVVDDIVQNNIVGLFLANSGKSETLIQNDLFRDNNNSGPAGGTAIYADQFVSGNRLQNVTINANSFVDNENVAINLAASVQGVQSRITISNNASTGDGGLVDMFDTTYSSITSNTVTGSLYDSILLGGGDAYVTVRSNNLQSGHGNGITIDANPAYYAPPGAPVVLDLGLTVASNTIQGYAGSGIYVASDSSTRSIFQSNTSVNNAQDGIFIDTGNSENSILDNRFQGNRGFDAEDLSTGTGSAGTANAWSGNTGKTSDPAGLL